MQTLTYVLYQLDEAVRYINEGRLEQLRLALLLLDNAAELQVARRVRRERQSEDLPDRVRSRALSIGAIPHLPEQAALDGAEPLSATAKKRIERVFDAKLAYLAEHRHVLDPQLGRILSYLHRYRNEAYHSAHVRRETIRTAALIFVEANCDLLSSVFQVQMYASDEDYSWAEHRFGLKRPLLLADGSLTTIADEIRSSVLPALGDVTETLALHLRSRVDELLEGLDFIVDGTTLADRAVALRAAQLVAAIDRGEIDPSIDPSQFKAPWSLAKIGELVPRIALIELSVDRISAFESFSIVEAELEAVERDVYDYAAVVDSAIQYQIDVARGK